MVIYSLSKKFLMKSGFKYALFAAGLAAAVIIISGYRHSPDKDPQFSIKSDDRSFFVNAGENSYKFDTTLKMIGAGVCSHHLFMSAYISGFFKRLSMPGDGGRIKTFVIIGPNHYDRGNSSAAITDQRWKTPFGFVENDKLLTEKIVNAGYAEYDPDAFTFEHSMGALMPFISQYFPGAKVVPVIFRHSFTEYDARRLGEFLSENLDDSCFLLLSADFVHNRYRWEISPIDKHTAEVIKKYKEYIPAGIFPLLNMDCNRGMEVLMNYSYWKGFAADILLNTDSAFVSKKNIRATSYFFIYLGPF